MKVMIVDDSTAMRLIVKKTLRGAGFDDLDFVEAADGAQAFEAIQQSVPDLVLCDWNMPNMTGIQLLQKLNEAEIEVDFGFVTTESTAPMRELAREAGAKFLISKPFTTESFEQILSPYLG